MAEKNSFILYFGYRKHLALLSDADRGKLLMALFDYAENGKIPNFEGALAMAFSFIQDQMDRDASKYAAVCERNRINGLKGGRPPKATKSDDNPKKPKKTERFLEKPKKPDNDNEYDNDNDNDNDNENDVDIKPPLPPNGGSVTPTINLQEKRFEQFWAVYPRKVGKGAAHKAWMKIKPTTELFNKIMSSVENAKKSKQWQKDNGQYVPNPATWLNEGRWDDEFDILNDSKQTRNYYSSGWHMATGDEEWGSEK